MFMGSGGNNSGMGYKSDLFVNYEHVIRNGQPYIMCKYRSGKKVYVKNFLDGTHGPWTNWGCKDDLNN